jgi:hypothetical protein
MDRRPPVRGSREVSVVLEGSALTYRQLLGEAQELGRWDGEFAAAFESPGTAAPFGERCLGRTPAEFACFLWGDQPGNPPVGLELNAPVWYAAGFAEGLAARAGDASGASERARTRS